VRRVDEDASVLGCNDRIDDGSEIIDIGKGFDTEYDVIEGY
jgi:hypothetical protein